MKSRLLLLFTSFVFQTEILIAQQATVVSSPDKAITATCWLTKNGEPRYAITYRTASIIRESKLGLATDDGNFAQDMTFINASAIEAVKDHYELYTGKKSLVNYTANRRTIHLKNSTGKKLDIIFQISNDGVTFRYVFPDKANGVKTITEEQTTFHFDTSARAFLQPMQIAKTGWQQTNPAYEEHYLQNIPVTDSAPTNAGWVYPALFRQNTTWVLITEAAVDSNYCATRLQARSPEGEYHIGFPDVRETVKGGTAPPKFTTPYASPWRIITIGGLKTIAESTLGTDLAKPSIAFDKSFIKPGKSSWSWIMSKDDSIVYTEQLRYIDYAANMNWQYCLIDVNWDQKIGYDKIAALAKYAATKNVGLLLWYNSAGDWNTVKYTPKGKLLTHSDRMAEFNRLKAMGIKGIKIDFFGGDGQSVMQYYTDILRDAATVGLMVNFHGATLPRGWQRTYPNLVTTEAVRGFEMITFNQADADAEAAHCAMLSFARNAFDPMDFTPMNLYKIPTKVKRKTTSGFELATSVLFYSGIQHFAESPDGMSHVPDYVQQFLRALPVRWDDVRFIDGYPGQYAVIARKAGSKWYIAGINAGDTAKRIEFNLSNFNAKTGSFISDGTEPHSFLKKNVLPNGHYQIIMKPSGGFVMVLE